jgi:hypothetical protein
MPRKTTKKPTAKKVAAKKAAPKRKKYQTGGTAKPQMPRSQALAMQEARDREAARLAQEAEMQRQIEIMRQDRLPPEPTPEPDMSQYADRINRTMERYRREQGLMELGNRQRAAAARARTTSRRGPTAAEQARNMAEYERAMRARQANLSRGSTPSPRPRPVRSGPNVNNTTQAQYQQMLQQRRIGAAPASQPPVRTQPAQPPVRDPNPRAGNVFTQQMQAERSRIQQQIAQLQARLRQLGG